VTPENPIPEHASVPDASGKAHEQTSQPETEISPTTARPQVIWQFASDDGARKQEKNWWDKWKPFVEMSGAILLAVYARYTIKIYKANRDAANAAHDTLGQIQQQTTLMQQEVEGAMAAIITKQLRITWPRQAYLSLILDNRGRAITSDIHADFHLATISLPDQRVIGNALPDWEFSIPEIGPAPDFSVERGTYLNISQEELKGHPIPRAIKLTGTFTYFNGFRKRSESVCYYVLGAVEFRNKVGAVQESIGPSVLTCEGLPAQVAWYLQTQKDIAAK
jgi:hypothetical protein